MVAVTTNKPKSVTEPFMAKDEDEFIKSLFVVATTIPVMIKDGRIDETEATIMFVDMFKMMAHDYHALAMAGKIGEYEFDKNDPKCEFHEMRKMFEDSLSRLTICLAQDGVPVVEGENGKLKIDYEKMHEMHAKGENNE